MQVLLIRHAPARDREAHAAAGLDEFERPLTARGRRRMRRAAAALPRLLPRVDALVTSPLLRAVQTAEIVARAYGDLKPVELTALAPGRGPRDVGDWLATRDAADVLAAVGHEPDLGLLATWCLAGLFRPFVELKKGAACLLEFPQRVGSGSAKLLWSLRPGQLRRIAAG